MNKYFKILSHIDPSLHRSDTYKKAMKGATDTNEILLEYAIEIIKVMDEKFDNLKTELEKNGIFPN